MNCITKTITFALFTMAMVKPVNGQSIRLGENPHTPGIVLREGPFYLLIDNKGSLTTVEPELFQTGNEVRIEYDLNGRIERFGSTSVDYDLDGRVRRIGDLRIDYEFNGRIRQIGDRRFDYDLDGRLRSVSGGAVDRKLMRRYRMIQRINQ